MLDLLLPKEPETDKPLFEDCGDYRQGYIDLIEEVGAPNEYRREFDILREARKTDKVLPQKKPGSMR